MNYASVPATFRVVQAPAPGAGSLAPGSPADTPKPARGSTMEEIVAARAGDVAGRLLAEIARDRSSEAFAELFDCYAGRLKHFFVRGGIEAGRAEELVQDVLLAVWRRADTYDERRSSALTWIYTLARNRRIDEFRLQGRAAPKAEDLAWDAVEACSIESTVEQGRKAGALRKALEALPAEQRAVLRCTFFDGKSFSEVASESGLPLGTVKSRARLAIERLRRVLHSGEDLS